MKSSVLVATLLAASFVWAQGAAPATAKLDKKQAKAECLKENSSLKGKELSHCVKSKIK